MKQLIRLLIPFVTMWWLITASSLHAAPMRLQTPSCNTTSSASPSQQIYRATSMDGLAFTAGNILLIDQATAPAALTVDGQVWLYFVNTQANQGGIGLARQNRGGSFEVIGCITLDGVFNPQAINPALVRLSDGRYRLFYNLTLDAKTIFSAISSDGLNFTVEDKTLTDDQAAHPAVIQLSQGGWLLAYQAGSKIAFATSQDGAKFSSNQRVLETTGQNPTLMALGDGRIRLITGGQALASFISSDGGQSWVKEQSGVTLNQARLLGAYDPTVIATSDGSWMLFYVTKGQANEVNILSGTVLLQGRADNSGTEIYLSNASCSAMVADTPKVRADTNGNFKVDLTLGQTYQCLQARKTGYLIAQLAVSTGDVGTITLLGGDVNADNLINIFDLALIAGKYDSSDPTVDVNGDKLVDIFDLTITAINYNKRGPI